MDDLNNKIITMLSSIYSEVKEYPNAGVSNYVYLCDEKDLVKASYDKNFLLIDDRKLLDKLYNSGISCKYLNNSNRFVSFTEYLNRYKPLEPSKYTQKHLDQLLQTLKLVHSIDIEYKPLTLKKIFKHYFSMLKHKRRYVNLSKLYSTLNTTKYVFSHFDLVCDNILFSPKCECKIIDFDLACVTDYRFDLLSLITENNFNEEQKQYLIDNYFEDKNEKDDFITSLPFLTFLFDYLWYIWAEARKVKANETYKIKYGKISASKYNAAKHSSYNKLYHLI